MAGILVLCIVEADLPYLFVVKRGQENSDNGRRRWGNVVTGGMESGGVGK